MNCSECKSNLYHLLENNNDTLAGQLKKHIASCPDCYSQYENMLDVAAVFKEGKKIEAPSSVQNSIMTEVNRLQAEKRTGRLVTLKKAAIGIAAILILILVIPFMGGNPNAAKATELLKNAITALESIKTMVIKLDIKTKSSENFQYIDKNEPMMAHVITEDFKNKSWRIDKTGRTAFMKNDTTYIFIHNKKLAVYIPGDARGIMGWFSLLLDPTSILRKENLQAHKKGSDISIKEIKDEIRLTINSGAEGVFTNDIGKDQSIEESDNRREYVFDKKTNLLKTYKVYLIEKDKEILVLEIRNIQYNIPVESTDFALQLPPGLDWEEFKLPEKNEKFSSLMPEQVARMAFEDLSKSDFETHPEIWGVVPKSLLKIINEEYSGLEIISIGNAFQSGVYPGYFVPYKIRLKNGNIKTHNLAIRNDNPNKAWMIDGGY